MRGVHKKIIHTFLWTSRLNRLNQEQACKSYNLLQYKYWNEVMCPLSTFTYV